MIWKYEQSRLENIALRSNRARLSGLMMLQLTNRPSTTLYADSKLFSAMSTTLRERIMKGHREQGIVQSIAVQWSASANMILLFFLMIK